MKPRVKNLLRTNLEKRLGRVKECRREEESGSGSKRKLERVRDTRKQGRWRRVERKYTCTVCDMKI